MGMSLPQRDRRKVSQNEHLPRGFQGRPRSVAPVEDAPSGRDCLAVQQALGLGFWDAPYWPPAFASNVQLFIHLKPTGKFAFKLGGGWGRTRKKEKEICLAVL